jgi:hypothetical protein
MSEEAKEAKGGGGVLQAMTIEPTAAIGEVGAEEGLIGLA